VTLSLRYAARSEVGLLRDGNEDAAYAGPRLLAVADGMGGHAAGEVASAVTISSVAPLDQDVPGPDLLSALRAAAEEANGILADVVDQHPWLDGMGTTLTALLWSGTRLGVVHVGDSRAYLLRDGELHQITQDHTLVQSLIDAGRISTEEADVHPQRSLITRALDGRGEVEPDLSIREGRRGDRYLLCTDGLTGVVSEPTIREALMLPDPAAAVDRLVDLALRAGGPDNVTCIVADVVEDAAAHDPTVIVAGSALQTRAATSASDVSAAGRAALARLASAPKPSSAAPAGGGRPAGRTHRRLASWPVMVVLSALVVLGLMVAGGWVLVHRQYYVGVSGTNVAVFRGVTGSFAGVDLSSVSEQSTVRVDSLPQFERDRVHQGIAARNLTDARAIVSRLKNEALPPCPGTARSPAPTASAAPATSAGPVPTPAPNASPCRRVAP
jgi:PPM family protein phosphatase